MVTTNKETRDALRVNAPKRAGGAAEKRATVIDLRGVFMTQPEAEAKIAMLECVVMALIETQSNRAVVRERFDIWAESYRNHGLYASVPEETLSAFDRFSSAFRETAFK